jgi:hypothetical protein
VTTFRYHIVSLLSVFLALAVGIALGGGPLSEIGRADDGSDAANAGSPRVTAELAQARAASGFQDEVTTGLAPDAIGDAIARRTVSIVTLPGADKKVVAGLTAAVKQGGGVLTGTYAVRPKLVAPDGKSLVDTLGAQVAESVKDADIPTTATTYDRIGQLIGRAVATTTNAGDPTDDGSADILSSLRGAQLLDAADQPTQRSSLVLVVLGKEPADDSGSDIILGGIAERADSVVVAGSTASATDGVLKTLRDDDTFVASVSSVDSDQTAAGRLVAVLALAADMDGEPGHYGASGADGALPQD